MSRDWDKMSTNDIVSTWLLTRVNRIPYIQVVTEILGTQFVTREGLKPSLKMMCDVRIIDTNLVLSDFKKMKNIFLTTFSLLD